MAFASCAKRRRASAEENRCEAISLSDTYRCNWASIASQMVPMPPPAILRSRTYLPLMGRSDMPPTCLVVAKAPARQRYLDNPLIFVHTLTCQKRNAYSPCEKFLGNQASSQRMRSAAERSAQEDAH